MYQNIAILGAFIFLYSISCGGLKRTVISGAIVFTGFGFIFGPLVLGLLNLNVDSEVLRALAELTLALVLFTDAANANLAVLKRSFHIPQRLLLIGLPLTIFLGFGVAVFLFRELSFFEAAILATILAPTDAALGKAVVTDESVPSAIRESLNVESGLNDGICVPILFIFLSFATISGSQDADSMLALKLVGQAIGIGIVVGLGLTVIAVWLINFFVKQEWITQTWKQIPVISLAIVCFATAQCFGGSGFIAAFVGGLLFGSIARYKKYKQTLLLAAEGTGDTFALITWVMFGAIVLGHFYKDLSWQVLLYSVLSLTVIRMLPVFLTLTGMNLRTSEKLFIGWFGPRGLASIVFAVIVINKKLPGNDTMVITVVSTIVLSIIAHGISANPLVAMLGKEERKFVE